MEIKPEARLIIGAGIVLLFGVFCPMLVAAGVVGGAATIELFEAFASVATGTIANAVDDSVEQTNSDRVSLENHDLTKTVGKAIATAIRESAKENNNKNISDDLKSIATHAENNWVTIAQEKFTQENYSQLKEAKIDQFLTPEEYRLTEKGNLSVEDWKNIFTDLCGSYKSSCAGQTCAYADSYVYVEVTPEVQLSSDISSSDIAKSLHEKFPKALQEAFKKDFKQDGKAFAILILKLLTGLKAEIEKQGKQQTAEFAKILDHINKLEPKLNGTPEQIQDFLNCLSTQIDVNFAEIRKQLGRIEDTQSIHLALTKKIYEQFLPKHQPLPSHNPTIKPYGPNNPLPNDNLDFYYIERPPLEDNVRQEIKKDGALLRIKGLKGSGKTSLLEKVIIPEAKKEGYFTVSLDFRKSPNLNGFELNKKLEELLKWLCKQIQKELGLNLDLNQFWDKIDDPKSNATNYLEKILSELDRKILLIGLDEIENIFNNPDISIDFCDLLRGWSGESSRGNQNSHLWKQLRIVVLHSREKYAQFDINSSPLAGVGTYSELTEFNRDQIKALIGQYQLNWSQDDIDNLSQLVGGCFELINHALKESENQNLTSEQSKKQAPTNQRIYRDHLLELFNTLNDKPELKAAFKTIIDSTNPVMIPNPLHVFHLESMGLVKLNPNDLVSPRCELYRQYFKSRI
ncbi:MAG: AAA-like domain-containing protein [Planktothrix sp.]